MLQFFAFAILVINIYNCASQGVTNTQLSTIMPNHKHPEYLQYINSAMVEGSINTCYRKSAFLAQLAHESGELRYMEEIASGAAYEGRKDLGNIYPGDGVRYKGRGPIQLTGRANYREAGKALGVDLENNPTMAATPQVGFRIAVWFWTTRGLNSLADHGTGDSFVAITRKINGGTNGLADREKFWNRALSVFGCTANTAVASCSAEGSQGTCIKTSACTGKSVAGHCSGASDIQCCIKAATAATACAVNGRSGQCIDKATCTGGTSYSGYCPGAANIQCCVKN